ncbi:MAG TPA: hypothetical protein VEY70_13255 [Metabacillus sp.]|nr:hypothetical protein [Metabacillus sp.]
MKNLLKLNQVRRIARTIKHEGFQREFNQVVQPILSMYQRKIVSDDEMLFVIKEAISKIEYIAMSYQYLANVARAKFKRNEEDFWYHGKFLEIEMLCKKLLNE